MTTLTKLARDIRAGVLTPREVVEATFARIDALDPELNSFISLRGEAVDEADEAPAGPLRGVPIAVKDVIDVAGARTTAASAILASNVAARDAEVVSRLRRAGAVVVGKLNTHEFAWGARSTSPHFGPVRNPWSLDRIAGGSSGGSAAAVAARLIPGSLGTDTGGSIRIPAAFCGVTGLRPTVGAVPTDGVFPVARSYDVVGPMAQTADDCRLIFDVIAASGQTRSDLGESLRVGLVSELFASSDSRVAEVTSTALSVLEEGCRLTTVSIPTIDTAGRVHQLLMLPEATEVHMPFLRTRLDEYGADVRARLIAGAFIPADAYVAGLRWRGEFTARLVDIFAGVDVLAAPTMPIVAPPVDDEEVTIDGVATPYRLAVIPFNSPWSLAGLPVLSVPCGFSNGLPVAVALIGPPGGEARLLALGSLFQRLTDWHVRTPPLLDQYTFTGSSRPS